MNKRISVIVSSYNQRDYLIEAIESVLSQTVMPCEIIISDDASSDGSQDLMREYADKYPGLIRPFYHDHNVGIPKNKNYALQHAKGELVTYLDGDDRFLPKKLEMDMKTLSDHPEAQVAYSNFYHIDAAGARRGLWVGKNSSLPCGSIFREMFGMKSPIWSLRNELVVYERLRDIGFNDIGLAMYHDWDVRVRLTKNCKVAYCPEPLAEYRHHSGGISWSEAARHLEEVRQVYQKNRFLLKDLPKGDRTFVRTGISRWCRKFALRAAKEQIRKGNRRLAIKYWMEYLWYNPKGFDPRLTAEIVVPKWVYPQLRAVYRAVRGNRL